jgi:phosphoribosylformimino-5-aminoimidazole carboxamide ribonucleotide (ProFAR) isomerase
MTEPAPPAGGLTLLPAVDLSGGQAVQLVQGDAGRESRYGDPAAAALAWQQAGAQWIHMVDLDAAFGRGSNAELIAGLIGRLDVSVELSGGIRDDGDRIAVGLDARGSRLAARGWTADGGDLMEVLARLEADGCARYVVTDVAKDGMLKGPNLDLLRQVCAATARPVIASGGVSSLDDLRAIAALRPLGVEGAIIGTALYEGAFALADALELVGR